MGLEPNALKLFFIDFYILYFKQIYDVDFYEIKNRTWYFALIRKNPPSSITCIYTAQASRNNFLSTKTTLDAKGILY